MDALAAVHMAWALPIQPAGSSLMCTTLRSGVDGRGRPSLHVFWLDDAATRSMIFAGAIGRAIVDRR